MKVSVCFLSFIGLFGLASVGVTQQRDAEEVPHYIRQYQSTGLPPVGEQITVKDRSEFMPEPIGLEFRDDAVLEVRLLSQRFTPELIFALRDIVLLDTRVQAAVGNRFTLVGGGQDQRKDVEKDAFTLDFYSYSNNQALTILLIGNEVVRIQTHPEGYQPPETHEEVEAAAEIVRRNPRFTDAVGDLTVRGIQTPGENENRHLYLMFYEANKRPAVFEATVDMTRGQVVSAGFISR